jgi:protocatechuate 3,4-dioxygenase, alpha subunit
MSEPTPPQTIGPFFSGGLLAEGWNVLAGNDTPGERIRLEGSVCDGDGGPVDDAMIEIWQANADGRYRHPLDEREGPLDEPFVGFGRSGTDEFGRYSFETIKPGPVPWDSGRLQAPHLNVHVFARGLLDRLATRIYFEGEPANEDDPLLQRVPAERRAALIARRSAGEGLPVYRFDIVLRGEGETVFFDA